MKILLAVDGSPCSDAAVAEVVRRPWPHATEVEVFSAVHAFPFVPEPTLSGVGIHYYSLDLEQKRAARAVAAAAQGLAARADGLAVTSRVAEGTPAPAVVEEARRCGADLIVLGSHGHGAVARHVLGSVSHGVVLHAPCSVEVVRHRAHAN